jgi:hypothetical protein
MPTSRKSEKYSTRSNPRSSSYSSSHTSPRKYRSRSPSPRRSRREEETEKRIERQIKEGKRGPRGLTKSQQEAEGGCPKGTYRRRGYTKEDGHYEPPTCVSLPRYSATEGKEGRITKEMRRKWKHQMEHGHRLDANGNPYTNGGISYSPMPIDGICPMGYHYVEGYTNFEGTEVAEKCQRIPTQNSYEESAEAPESESESGSELESESM